MPLEYTRQFLMLSVLLVVPNMTAFADCRCAPINNGEVTHWTGNRTELFISIEKVTYRQLKGKVLTSTNGAPFSGVLVEVFNNPDYLLPNHSFRREKQIRVAACRAGNNGNFCFADLSSGEYELRVSSDQRTVEWNTSQVYVVVDREKGKRKDLIVAMIPRS
jgi:hypothetical protein